MERSRHHQQVSDILSQTLICCSLTTSLFDVVRLMQSHNVSAIFIKQHEEIVGIWTEADCIKLDFTSDNLKHIEIQSLMTSPVLKISKNQLLREAALIFYQYSVRHLLVVDGDEHPCGMISVSDVVRNQGLEHYLKFRTIQDQYQKDVLVAPHSLPLSKAVEMMRERRAQVILVHNQQLDDYGIITQRDLLHLVAEPSCDAPCWQFSNKPLYQVNSKSSLFDAYRIMVSNNIRHLVVRDEQAIKGVLAIEHLINEIENAYCKELEKALEQQNIELKHSQRNLFLANKIIDASLDGIMITKQNGVIIQVNPAFSTLTGYSSHEVVGKNPNILSSGQHDRYFYENMWKSISQKGVWQGEICNRKKNGETYIEWLTIITIRDPNSDELVYAAIFSDITERKNTQDKVAKLAYFDELTGLPNRRLFNDRLTMALAAAHRNNDMLAVMFIDLDKFKEVNDCLGHSAGDELLEQVAIRLQSVLCEGDTLARLGGDEFVILCKIQEVNTVIKLAEQILDKLSTSFELQGNETSVTASIGSAVYPDDGLDLETLLKHADIAMYRCKDIGRNSFQLFQASMNARSFERLAMMSRFQHALENNEFELYFQPKQCLKSKAVVGVEAFLRWHDTDLGTILPTQFISLAEQLGLVADLDSWVISQAGKELRLWQEKGVMAGRLAINISAWHLTQCTLASTIKTMLKQYQIPGDLLEIELTEGLFVDKITQVKAELKKVAELGVHIVLDDFGIGYSSLCYLTTLPFSALKIDTSLVAKMPDKYGNSQLVAAIIAMANSLKLTVVAEGVEHASQEKELKKLGCHVIQGNYFCRPLARQQWFDFYYQTTMHGAQLTLTS